MKKKNHSRKKHSIGHYQGTYLLTHYMYGYVHMSVKSVIVYILVTLQNDMKTDGGDRKWIQVKI